jgi:hypothetical protein
VDGVDCAIQEPWPYVREEEKQGLLLEERKCGWGAVRYGMV